MQKAIRKRGTSKNRATSDVRSDDAFASVVEREELDDEQTEPCTTIRPNKNNGYSKSTTTAMIRSSE